jgi:quercetin dioxygenase-like cupin family protein
VATIRFVSNAERKFISVNEEFNATSFTHHAGGPDSPQLFEVKYPPNQKITAHAHTTDEIIVMMEGEIHFGKQVYGIGSSVFIPMMTLYSFQAGPDGLTYLNFRPIGGAKFISRDEFVASRGERSPIRAEWLLDSARQLQ